MNDDLATYWQWMEQHGEEVGRLGGRIMGWYRGPNPVITTTCPEILKEVTSSLAIAVIPCIPSSTCLQVFIKDAENFVDRPLLDRSDNIPHLINMRGQDWKRARYRARTKAVLIAIENLLTFDTFLHFIRPFIMTHLHK